MSNEPSLTPLAAHNSLAAAVALYAGILADYERQLQFANAQMARDKAAHADQLREGKALNEKLFADVKLVNATGASASRIKLEAANHVVVLLDAYAAHMSDHKAAAVVRSALDAVRDTLRAEGNFCSCTGGYPEGSHGWCSHEKTCPLGQEPEGGKAF